MKAYIVKIELNDSSPVIWRRVILPADATFNRLHDIIQNVTNFKSGYPYDHYHLFEFNLGDLIVTNDEEKIDEHQSYQKNKKIYEEILANTSDEFYEMEKKRQDYLKIPAKYPSRIKIDNYLESGKAISYLYDFGDYWEFSIKLEEIVDDYYFGYPTLLDGAESAPPEDVGGIGSFYAFLKDYQDESARLHKDALEYAEATDFMEYNPEFINGMLKNIKYQKTEWNKINHKNYKIIEDKYRKE